MPSNYFNLHVHSHHSSLDGMSTVQALVDKAVLLQQPAMGLTDHGNMAGAVRLYKAASKAGIKAYPGFEAYLIDPSRADWESPTKGSPVPRRYHFGLVALDEVGYKALVKFSTMTMTRPRFNRFPRCTLADVAELGQQYGKHLALTTGCYFGLVQQTLVNEGVGKAQRIVSMLAQWFPNTYVELQHHNILHNEEDVKSEFKNDADIVRALADIADILGLPVIAAQDSHYTDQSEKKAHALMKRMTYGGKDDEFPGDSFHLASGEWVQEHYDEKTWNRVEEGFADLLSRHDLRLWPLDTFTPDVPTLTKTPKKDLRRALNEWAAGYLQGAKPSKVRAYEERIEYELDVINHLGMASYFLIWKEFVEWCRDEHIAIEARGSGNGSLVNFALGITQVDPIIWGVDFDRFLSKDRIKPPDIDMDIEDVRRPDCIAWLRARFGDATQIGTWSKLGSRFDEREDKEVGSILQSWQTSKRKECQEYAIAKMAREGRNKGDAFPYARAMFERKYGHVKDIRDVKAISPEDFKGLQAVSKLKPYRSYGVHASGVLLSGPKVKINEWIPLMFVPSSEVTVTQYEQDDVEEFGLLKMDILGQATLRTMRLCQKLMGRDDPTDFSWIPNDDPAACATLRSGRTETGIFHQEGYTKSRGCKEMGVRSTKDAILAQALYMPGAMDTGQTAHFNRARKDRDFRNEVVYLHPIFEKHLKETYGAYVFQNQVMSILRDMGLDVASINVFLKAVKDSGEGAEERNRVRLAPLKAVFDEAWVRLAIDPNRREETWAALCGFGAYGFNKAHAAGYGIRMYRCAYLKTHYPEEFMAALLETWAGRKKEPVYIREARRIGVRLLPPDVNVSGANWTFDPKRKAIRRGLTSIPDIGDKAAVIIADGAPYDSVDDMAKRLPARQVSGGKTWLDQRRFTGKLKALEESGALDSIPKEG